jgi:hypothetical protein
MVERYRRTNSRSLDRIKSLDQVPRDHGPSRKSFNQVEALELSDFEVDNTCDLKWLPDLCAIASCSAFLPLMDAVRSAGSRCHSPRRAWSQTLALLGAKLGSYETGLVESESLARGPGGPLIAPPEVALSKKKGSCSRT